MRDWYIIGSGNALRPSRYMLERELKLTEIYVWIHIVSVDQK